MNAQDPFDWLAGRGPNPAEQQAEMNEVAAQATRERAQLYASVFLHGRGPELLAELRDCTIEVGLMDVSRSVVRGEVALSPADWAYVREGQNSLVRMIEEQIRIAQTPEPQAIAPANLEGE